MKIESGVGIGIGATKIPVNLKWKSELKLFSDGTKLGTEPSILHYTPVLCVQV